MPLPCIYNKGRHGNRSMPKAIQKGALGALTQYTTKSYYCSKFSLTKQYLGRSAGKSADCSFHRSPSYF